QGCEGRHHPRGDGHLGLVLYALLNGCPASPPRGLNRKLCHISDTLNRHSRARSVTARLAILADIYANVWALDAVLKHAQKHGVDAFVNLGDTLYGPLRPHATYERLLHENVLATIQGNQDRMIFEASERDLATIPTLAYVIRDLGEEPIRWLSELPKTAVVNNDIFLCHGT